MKYLLCLTLSTLCIVSVYPQGNKYIIASNDQGIFLVKRNDAFLVEIPENNCYESIEENNIIVDKTYIIIEILSEENKKGAIIFDKTGKQIDYRKVQEERKKHYAPYNCCIYVREFKGLLLFWDLVSNENGVDYNCSYDSQTDTSGHFIPRYYIFNPKTGVVETKKLSSKCSRLIIDGNIVCD